MCLKQSESPRYNLVTMYTHIQDFQQNNVLQYSLIGTLNYTVCNVAY